MAAYSSFIRLFLCILIFVMYSTVHAASIQEVPLTAVEDVLLVGKELLYLEDSTGKLQLKDVLEAERQGRLVSHSKDVFSRPATKSAFWFRVCNSNHTNEDAWLEVGSTYAWYIDFYFPTGYGSYASVETGTMRPDRNKVYPGNLFWLPLNKAYETTPKVYYLRIESGLTYELPLQIGSIRSLSANKDTFDFITAGFVGLMLIMFLYNGFVYLYTRDTIYAFYLGYILLMLFSMPYANNYPFIQNFNFWFIDKTWWNSYFLLWHPPVYLFVGIFCIRYLKLKERAPVIRRIILIEVAILAGIFPLLTLAGFAFVELVNSIQPLILIFYLTCLSTGYYFLNRKLRPAGFYVLGWTFMVAGAFVFFAVINGYLPYTTFTRNALYFGTSIEVWMFSLALGSRLSALRHDKARMQQEMIELVHTQKDELENRVTQRTEDLRKSNAILKNANRQLEEQRQQLAELNVTKDRLFTMLGHDLQSPLVALENLLTMADYGELTSAYYERVSAKIRGDVQYLHLTLNNLMQWAVTQMEGLKAKKSTFDLHLLVDEIIRLGQHFASNKHIAVENHIATKSQLYADPNLLRVVFRNLLNNALKFTRPGGKVGFYLKEEKEYVEIAVQDTGVGMDEKRKSQLFTSLSIESSTGTQGEKGTGLGLMLCQDFIAKNQGEIRLESQEGVGTTFYVRLPYPSGN